jgi:hypothetical protein
VFYKEYFREALMAGRLPLWNPHVGLGRPFLADIETATLYPPNLLVIVLGIYGGVAVSVFLHQTLAVYGGIRLGMAMGASAWASFIVGAGMALSGPFTARLASGSIEGYFTLCWWPCLLWLGARLQDRWERREAAGFASCVALAILAGNPPLLYVELAGLAVFIAFRHTWPKGGLRRLLANDVGLAAAGLLGVGLAAAALLPSIELIGQGNRPLHSPVFALSNGIPPASWLSLIYPASTAFAPNWEYDLHCGLVPLFAAAAGMLLWRDRNIRGLLGLGIAGALLGAGDRAPFLGWAAHFMPGASALRLPSRYGIWIAASLLGIAAIGISKRTPRPIAAVSVALAVSVGFIVWLRRYVVYDPAYVGRYYAAHVPALVLAALLVVLWHQRHRLPRHAPLIACGLGVFCAANWLWAIHLEAPVYSVHPFFQDEQVARSALLEKGLFSHNGVPPRIEFDMRDFAENSGMSGGYSTYDSYSNPALARVWDYLHSATGSTLSAMDFIRQPTSIGERSELIDGANLAAKFERGEKSPVLRPDPDPRAYLVFRTQTVQDWREAEGLMAARRDFHTTALVERGDAPDFSAALGAHGGNASITRFEPERIVLSTDADAQAVLVLAEPWYPGWRATVGGHTADVLPVNGWMRGVLVPAGQSEVVFTFHSRFLAAGLAISLASAGILLALLLKRQRLG